MKRLMMTSFSIRLPWAVVLIALAATIFFGAQFPKVTFDNDPENMLAKDEPIRVFHNRIKDRYDLYDFVIVGIVNRTHPDGVFNVETLGHIDTLTKELSSLRKNEDGRPEIIRDGEPYAPELASDSAWERMLARVFGNDVYRLFDEDGDPAIIVPEIISPSVVDNIRQADRGRLAIEYLMESPPETRKEALAIRKDAMNNPLYKGTLASEDGEAMALYIPIAAKTFSYNTANLIEHLTAHWPDVDEVYITGQPVAQDTFGVEMLVQMATSAPMAGLAIFLLLLFFFRRISLIIAPMIVAIVSVVCTMGLLIGLGYDVHIMSSMIAIFLMPIAVADSVHILSEFFDAYPRFRDKAETIRHVVGHLFMPMLYTSLTTIAGFASLGATPIPPVRVFGLHVAFGVALAWLLTMTLVPSYIMLFVRTKMLDQLKPHEDDEQPGMLSRRLEALGRFSCLRWKLILLFTALVMMVSVYGISRIRVNDNPVKWFTADHRIRVADRVLNDHFGGTYTAYLTVGPKQVNTPTCQEKLDYLRNGMNDRYGAVFPKAVNKFSTALDQIEIKLNTMNTADEEACFADLVKKTEAIDEELTGAWNKLGDAIIYMDPPSVTWNSLTNTAAETVSADIYSDFLEKMQPQRDLQTTDLQNRALDVVDAQTSRSLTDALFELKAEITAPTFKRPEILRYIAELQQFLDSQSTVGKTSSAVDALKKAHYELNYNQEATVEKNDSFYSVPDAPSAVGQVFIQLEGMKKKDSLFHMVTRDYNEVNIWIQLTSGDNTKMQAVVDAAEKWMNNHPAPDTLESGWAGLTYLNVVWQDKMVAGMLNALLSSFIVVLIMMMVLFRSPLFGLLAMIPLSVTITFIYGLIGLVGKDYDMPVAVLSSLTLGLSVDFAIHFLERSREFTARHGSWKDAAGAMFREPAMAISRNAIIISIGFTPLLFAPLVPYKTVGFFLATIMAVSWIATLFILAALITGLQRWLFKTDKPKNKEDSI